MSLYINDDHNPLVHYLIIISDDLADRPILRAKTSLQVADVENFNFLAKIGSTGLTDPLGPDIAPGSDEAHLNILGNNPQEIFHS